MQPDQPAPQTPAPQPGLAKVAPSVAPQTPIAAPAQPPAAAPAPARVVPAATRRPRRPSDVWQEGDPVIVLDHVTKRFGEYAAVNNVSFEVKQGEIFGFIGPSGSGKTTAMRLINGIFTPTEGTAKLFGQDPAHPTRELHERFGYLPQLFVLYGNLSVEQNMNFMAAVQGLGWRERRQRIREKLDFVEIWNSRKTLARNISGGMQRRLELAASLIHNPTLLFADEPTAGIDPVLRGKFWDEFRRLRQAGHTLFVTTQYVGESEYCDRVGVIRKGELIALGTPLELRRMAMGGDMVDVSSFDPLSRDVVVRLSQLPFVMKLEDKPQIKWVSYPHELRLNVIDAGEAIPKLVPILQEAGVRVKELQEYKPTFDEVFIALMGGTAEAE